MAEKSFGIKEIKFFGSSPKIESPNNLNLNAVNVAISTNATIGGTLSVTGNVSVGGTLTYEDLTNIDSVGLITARSGIDCNGDIDVDGHTNLDNVSVAGVSTYTGAATFNGSVNSNAALNIGANSHINLSTGNWAGDAYGKIQHHANRLYLGAGSNADPSFVIRYDGSDRIYMTSGGTFYPTADSFSDLGKPSVRWANGYFDTLYGDGSNLTGITVTPTNSDIQVVYTVTANGSSAYRFAGNGVVSTADDPDLYLIRGQKYRFINNSGGSHPFQIRESSGGTAYSTGVTNNGASSGNIDFAPTYDSPAQLVYQCTSHSGMVGNIYLRDAAGNDTNVGVTTFVTNTDGTTDILTLHADANGTNNGVASIKLMGNTGNHAAFIKGGHTTNGDTILTFHTDAHASGINPEERLRITSDGAVMINTTNSSSRTLNLKGTFGILSASQTGVLDMSVSDAGAAVIAPYVAGGSSLELKTNASGAGVATRMTIQSTGIVKVETSDSSGLNAHILVNNSESSAGVSLLGSGSSFSSGGWAAVTDAGIIRSSAGAANGLVLQAASGDLKFYASGNPPAERLNIRGTDGRVTVKNDIEFDTDGVGGLFGKIVRSNAAYSANSNMDIAITQGNYIFSVRSGGVYHYNGIFMVTYYDSADKDSEEVVHGDYQTSVTHSVIHNGSNNGTFRLVFNRSFDGLNVRQLKLS